MLAAGGLAHPPDDARLTDSGLLDSRQPSCTEVPMRSIGLAVVLIVGLFVGPLVGHAQQTKVARIGVLTLGVPPSARAFAGLRQGLQDLGYLEGRNLAIEYRYAEGQADRFPILAAELVGSNVDVIVTESTAAALAAKDATQTIPIVMTTSSDPVKSGLAASFARPGGNVTGLTLLVPELSQKRLQLLKEVAPKATRVAVLLDSTNPLSTGALKETEAAAQSLGLQLQPIVVRSPATLDAVFKSVTSARPHVLITIGGGMLLDSRIRIVEFAAKSRLP